MIIAATGHRPERPGMGGYSDQAAQRRRDLAYSWLMTTRPELVIVGMALGWDTEVAEAAYNLHIPFRAAIPFEGQHLRWPLHSQHAYRALRAVAADEVIISPTFTNDCMHRRNMYMVNHCDHVMALWDGVNNGGTASCVKYAKRMGVPVTNLWDLHVAI